MEIAKYINRKKEIYENFLNFVENENDSDDDYIIIIKLIETQKIYENHDEFHELFKLILQISIHHHRHPLFIKRIQQILYHLLTNYAQSFTNIELYKLFRIDKLILLFLFTIKLINVDQAIADMILHDTDKTYSLFFHKEIDSFVDEETRKQIQSKIKKENSDNLDKFEEKRQIGENDSYLCHLIRNDLIEEFVSFTNRINFPISTATIKASIFETNIFLIENELTLIEYAAFFGSFQIFQYLLLNKVDINKSLWICAIHGNNPEIIHLLEKNVELDDELLMKCYEESIKCHHNKIAIYLQDNKMISQIQFSSIFEFYNYEFFPEDFEEEFFTFYYACKYDHLSFVKILLENKAIKLNNSEKIKISSFFLNGASLNLASRYNKLEISQFLANKGIEFKPEKFNSSGKITIPSNSLEISNYSFQGFKNLTSIRLSEQATSNCNFSFQNSKEFAIPNSLNLFEEYNFSNENFSIKISTSFIRIDVPFSNGFLPEIAYLAFSTFEQFDISSSSIIDQKTSLFFFEARNKFGIDEVISYKQIKIPSSNLLDENLSFDSNSKLPPTEINFEIPSSVKYILCGSFYGCTSLTSITIPSSVTITGKNSFEKCQSLTQVNFEKPSKLISIWHKSFCLCSSLREISIPESVKTIGSYAFSGCSLLSNVIIPSSVVFIGDDAFRECSSLTEILIPSSVEFIGNCAFYNCCELAHIKILAPIKKIDNSLFNGCIKLANIDIPETVSSIGYASFKNCVSLTCIQIPSFVQTIGDSAFFNCISLAKISISPSLMAVGNSAFTNCSSLKQIIFTYSLKSIGVYAFKNCTSLEKISIPHHLLTGKLKINSKANITRLYN